MSSTRGVIVVAVWVAILGGLAGGYFLAVKPMAAREAARTSAEARYGRLFQEAVSRGRKPPPLPDDADLATIERMIGDLELTLTSPSSDADGDAPGNLAARAAERARGNGTPATGRRVSIALDGYSGYAVLRSGAFASALGAGGMSASIVDDRADMSARFESLRRGQTPVAVFTIDALIVQSQRAGSMPGAIVAVLGESVGADAIVADGGTFASVDAINVPGMKIVAPAGTPSEMLGRVMLSSFDLSALGPAPFEPIADAAAGVERFRRGTPGETRVYALWEPFVTRALAKPGARVVFSSASVRGMIVDVLVVQREFLIREEASVRTVVESYFRALWEVGRDESARATLIRGDAAASGEPLDAAQSLAIARGIWFKNTTENYQHLGLLPATGGEITPVPEMARAITGVLLRTGGIASDPAKDRPESWMSDGVLRRMKEGGFYPGASPGQDAMRAGTTLGALTPEQWGSLIPVGTLQVDRIVFARGAASLTDAGRGAIATLADRLRALPRFYITVRGNARPEGDRAANEALAIRRAQAVAEALIAAGVAPERVRTVSGVASAGAGGEGQSVTFQVGQMPY